MVFEQVIAGVVSLYYHAAPRSYLGHCTQALLRMYLLSSTQDSCQDALQLISKITSHIDKDLSPFASQFFLFGGDSLIIQDLKLSVLEDLESAYEQVMPELLIYIKSGDVPLMARSVKVLFYRGCLSSGLTYLLLF